MISGCKVKRHKSQPYDARRIHSEANVLRFIECLGNFACQHGINGAHNNEDDGEEEGDHVGGIDMRITYQVIILARWVVILCMCGCYQYPYHIYEHLEVVFLVNLAQKISKFCLTWIDIRKLQIMS